MAHDRHLRDMHEYAYFDGGFRVEYRPLRPRTRKSRPVNPYAGMDATAAWQKWYRDSGSPFQDVEDIEAALGRRE